MNAASQDVPDYWLDRIGPQGWYEQDDAVDTHIRSTFGATWDEAAQGGHDDWATTPTGSLALLILLDQFPRNMFRGDARAFSTDAKALTIAKAAVAAGHDLKIDEPQRQFFYLPYMHAENIADQDTCVALIAERMSTGDNLFHAKAHRAVIRSFGRFPYRNAALGRENTTAEQAYIDAGLYAPEDWDGE